jgi:ectoine hydroxylase-related dioxygenase (phytanoyl-CoA dioxygenase family)
VSLSDEQVRRFEEHGFLRLEELTSSHEVLGLHDVYDRLFEPDTVVSDTDRIELARDAEGRASLPQILNPDHYAPELLETTAYLNAVTIAGQLLGDDVQYMGMHAIRKPARDGAQTPWHQDEAYWDPAWEHRAISVWMPLQPATLSNGCMQFVPGTHRLEVREHRLIGPDSDGLVVTDTDSVADAVACPLPPGGATIHSGRTLHYAGPNLSDEPRRALIMAFRSPPQRLDAPRAFPWQRPEWYE